MRPRIPSHLALPTFDTLPPPAIVDAPPVIDERVPQPVETVPTPIDRLASADAGVAARGESASETPTETQTVTVVVEPLPVRLGTPELTAGIPGDGDLTAEQIQAWLAGESRESPPPRAGTPGRPAGGSAVGEYPGTRSQSAYQGENRTRATIVLRPAFSTDGTVSCVHAMIPMRGTPLTPNSAKASAG